VIGQTAWSQIEEVILLCQAKESVVDPKGNGSQWSFPSR
jgi:hypothetical protein